MANNRKKGSPAGVIFALLMLIVIVIALVIVLRSCQAPGGNDDTTPTPPAATEQAGGNEATTPPESGSTASTAPVTPTAAPTATPSPSPTPAPTPSPTPVPSASGSIRSDSGTKLNIVADWSLNGGTLNVNVSAESYALYSSGAWHALVLKVGGQTYYADTKDIEYEGPGLGVNELGSFSVSGVSAGSSIEVTWIFQGKYGDTELETITATGTVA